MLVRSLAFSRFSMGVPGLCGFCRVDSVVAHSWLTWEFAVAGMGAERLQHFVNDTSLRHLSTIHVLKRQGWDKLWWTRSIEWMR
jgi:hypothetical protein